MTSWAHPLNEGEAAAVAAAVVVEGRELASVLDRLESSQGPVSPHFAHWEGDSGSLKERNG